MNHSLSKALGLLLAAIPFSLVAEPAVDAVLAKVDPFIGTGFHGHTFPGATTPFGMVQLSPDNRTSGWMRAVAIMTRTRKSGDSAAPISAAPALAATEMGS
jgi:putative alpha-1,2-mannosidase